MKVLLFTSKEEDYLQDSIIHGFKQLLGKDAVDYPTKEILYNDYADLKNIRGNGFTLYGLLSPYLKPDEQLDIDKEISLNRFNLIVFTSIYRQYNFFYKYFKLLRKSKAVVWVMDGEDSPVLFPYLGKHLKNFLFSPKPHHHFIYFKRELSLETLSSIYFRLPVSSAKLFSFPENIKPISFSIPQEKIINHQPAKYKLFVRHIVDNEVAINVNRSENITLFDSEQEYYSDIQSSKFGITTKRAGWDCLRHYEIAANGAVICFKNLDKKPGSCAPHGLIKDVNCISYSDYTNLMDQINNLSDYAYINLQIKALAWVKNQSTVASVSRLINKYYQEVR